MSHTAIFGIIVVIPLARNSINMLNFIWNFYPQDLHSQKRLHKTNNLFSIYLATKLIACEKYVYKKIFVDAAHVQKVAIIYLILEERLHDPPM
jgi:hypothetical protein